MIYNLLFNLYVRLTKGTMIMLEPSNNKEMGILILVEEVLQDYTLKRTSYKLFI